MADSRFQVTSFTIAISQSVSEPVDIRGSGVVGLWVPELNAATSLTIMVGDTVTDVASANYVDMYEPDGTLFGINAIAGSMAVTLTPNVLGFTSFKVRVGVPQSAARHFRLIQRL